MKPILIALGIVVVLAVGYYFVVEYSPAAQSNTTQQPQAGGSQAKINIDAVCQGALAYMTFPDGAAAEKFVAECKEGKHPEVIEKYRADMNLGAGAAI